MKQYVYHSDDRITLGKKIIGFASNQIKAEKIIKKHYKKNRLPGEEVEAIFQLY